MKIDVWADHAESADRNAEKLEEILALGHTVSINNFMYCRKLANIIFKYHIMSFSLIGLHSGQKIIDADGVERKIACMNTSHVYLTTEGTQVIIGDFELAKVA